MDGANKMIKSVGMLGAFRVETENCTRLVLVDFASGTAYAIYESDLPPPVLSSEETFEIIAAFSKDQAATAPSVPYEKIREVMDTEKRLSSEGGKHIFRGY